jgi:hypothetical protein
MCCNWMLRFPSSPMLCAGTERPINGCEDQSGSVVKFSTPLLRAAPLLPADTPKNQRSIRART